VVLLGVDTPSVDRQDDDQLVPSPVIPARIVNLETLTLAVSLMAFMVRCPAAEDRGVRQPGSGSTKKKKEQIFEI
jgi:hypothetical protein